MEQKEEDAKNYRIGRVVTSEKILNNFMAHFAESILEKLFSNMRLVNICENVVVKGNIKTPGQEDDLLRNDR